MYICIYAYMYICICIYCMYVSLSLSLSRYIYIYIYVYIYIYYTTYYNIAYNNNIIMILMPGIWVTGDHRQPDVLLPIPSLGFQAVRHRLNGFLAHRVPSLFLDSIFRMCLSCEVLKGMLPWRTRYPLS